MHTFHAASQTPFDHFLYGTGAIMKRRNHFASPLSSLILLLCMFSVFLFPGCKQETDRKKNLLETTLIAAHEIDEGYDYNIENLKLTKVEVTDPKVIVGHTCKMKITIESSEPRTARDVPVSFYLINNNDLKSENGEVRQIYIGSPAIDRVKPGNNTYDIEIVIPQVNGHYGNYTLFSVFHDYVKNFDLAQDFSGDVKEISGEKTETEILLQKKITTDVIITSEYVNSCDLYMPELIIQDDVIIIFTDKLDENSPNDTDAINGTVKAMANGAVARNVKIKFFLKSPDGTIAEPLAVVNQSDQSLYSLDFAALQAYTPVDQGFVLDFPSDLRTKVANYMAGLGKKTSTFTISAEIEGSSEAPMMNNNNIKTREVQIVLDNPREAKEKVSSRLPSPLQSILNGFSQTLNAAPPEDKTRHDWWGPLAKDPHAAYNCHGKEWFGIGFHFDTWGYNIFDKSDHSRDVINLEANANIPLVLFTKEFKIISAEAYLHAGLSDLLGLHAMEDEFHKKGKDGTVQTKVQNDGSGEMKYNKDKICGFSVRLCVLNDKPVFKYQLPGLNFEWKTEDMKDVDSIFKDAGTYKTKNPDFSRGQTYFENSKEKVRANVASPFSSPPLDSKDKSKKHLGFYSEISYTATFFVLVAPISIRLAGFFSFGIGGFARIKNNISIGIIPFAKIGCKVEGLVGGTFLGGGIAVTIELLKLENRNLAWCDFDVQSRNDPNNTDKKVKMRFNFAIHCDMVLWGPKGDIKLVAYYKFIKFCTKWKIPYPCGLEQKKSEMSVYKFPMGEEPLWNPVFLDKAHLLQIPLE